MRAQTLIRHGAGIGPMDVAVLGAGPVGQGIAHLAAVAGHDVSLRDEEANTVMDGIDDIERHLDEAVADGHLDEATIADARDRLEGTTGLDAAVTDTDVVIDTETADVDALRALLAEVEDLAGRETLLATSVPSVSVTAAATGLRHPDRAIGLHVTNPPAGDLVEVVVAEQTTAATRDGAVAFVESLDRNPIVVRDAPGFAATRLALALEVEAIRMVEDGVAGVEAVDRALELDSDLPTGPLERADRVGLDQRLDQLAYLADVLDERFEPPALLREMVGDGRLGQASGEGFYEWENDEPVGVAGPEPDLVRSDTLQDDPATR